MNDPWTWTMVLGWIGSEGQGAGLRRAMGKKWDNCNRINKYKIYKENDKLTTTKLKMDLTFDPAIPFLGIYPKEPKTLIQKNISTPMFIAVLFTITNIWKQPKCPSVDE